MTSTEMNKKHARTLSGVVVSDKMQKTLVVAVESTKIHPKYGKRFVRTTRYKVHDEKSEYHVGDMIRFVECRPLSKDKRWRAVERLGLQKS